MTNDFEAFLDAANAEFDNVAMKGTNPEFARKKFTCEGCQGSGLWKGGKTNSYGNNKCNVCHGNGFLVTDPARRRQRAERRSNRKASQAAGLQADNIEAIGGQDNMDRLVKAAEWSSFAGSLLEQHRSGRAWSEKQANALNSMIAKLAAKEADRAKADADASTAVDLSPIKAMFDAAVGHGYKRPKYRAEGLIISRAPDHGRNAGALYVKDEHDEYMGKIINNRFFPTRNAEQATQPLLVIAADPHGAAVRYGNRTGRCACCGRELTKDESIARGIGPVCAERWGLGDLKMNLTKEEAKAELQKGDS